MPTRSSAPENHHGREAFALRDGIGHVRELTTLIFVERQVVETIGRDDHEPGQVDHIRPLAQDLALRTALAAAFEEVGGVLEVVGLEVRGEGLCGFQRAAVPREDIADLPLRDRHHRHDVDRVLERHEPVQSAAQDVRLEAGLAGQSDQARLDRATTRPALLDDSDALVGSVKLTMAARTSSPLSSTSLPRSRPP
jgi:hypothetical protein